MNPSPGNALFLRRRSVWEAADSGVLLWRSNFIYFIPFFILPVAAAACVLRFIPVDFRYFPYLALWWLKPLFDRLVLHVVSLRFFGDPPPSRLRELCRGLSGIRRGLLGDLLWRRFSPGRAARMPIRVLERAGGSQYRQRKETLSSGGLDFCPLVSLICFALEVLFLLSEIAFTWMLINTFFPAAADYLRAIPKILEVLIFAAFCFNYILAGSLYVCMGFGLYINSRVEVEGWDLQLLFQKFSGAPEGGKPASGGVSRTAILAALIGCLFLPQTAYSQKEAAAYFPEDFPAAGSQQLQNLETILTSPDFGGTREGWGIRFKESEDVKLSEKDSENIALWLEKIRQTLGYIIRGLAVLAVAGLAGFALYWYFKNRKTGASRSRRGGKSYRAPFFSPESPESLFARAEDFFARGNLREAWAACLAACIAACAKYRAISFPACATEYACLELVRRALPAEAAGFEALVQSWVLFAYGGKPPDEGDFEKALTYGRLLLKQPAAAKSRATADGAFGEA